MANKEYQEFLATKMERPVFRGFDVDIDTLHPDMHLFQRDIVTWSLKLGKSAIFSQVGTGKTLMQLQWAKSVHEYTGKPVMILAPLAVAHQTVREGDKWGIPVIYCRDETEIAPDTNIIITNYHRLEKFDNFVQTIGGIVLDESSILKNFTGKTKRAIIEIFKPVEFKLAASATPAPNDHMELGNHADFLDIMPSNEMLSRWFINDTMQAGGYRLKKHGVEDFWRWLTSWAVCLTKPSDLGDEYDMDSYDLPPLNIIGHFVAAPQEAIDKAQKEGRLFPDTAPSSTQLGRVKRESLDDRLERCIELIESMPDNEPILIWCILNDESDALSEAFPDAVEVRGSDNPDSKTEKLLGFSEGDYRILITKPSIAGHGMNWQHCNQMIFFGLDFKFEAFYQAKGRCHRYGQKQEVNAHIIFAETENNVIATLQRKQDDFEYMQSAMAKSMKKHGLFRDENRMLLTESEHDEMSGDSWRMLLGDCVERIADIPDNSIHFGIHSPPFSNLYIYSDSEADMGNAKDDAEFFAHYKYLIRELYRTTMPGRLQAIHCKDLPAYMNRDGAAGLRDFSGQIIQAFEEMDKPQLDDYTSMKKYKADLAVWNEQSPKWQFHSRVTIWKDPVIEMQRTKNHGLLHKNFVKEANACRQGMADYLVVFRKHPLPEKHEKKLYPPVKQARKIGQYVGLDPVTKTEVEIKAAMFTKFDEIAHNSILTWQKYASPVWYDIDQTNVLNFKLARSVNDERHICPLQLDVIERAIDLWTNEGETVFTPFAGVGSELVSAIKMGRKAIGIELKRDYFNYAVKFCEEAESANNQRTLFDLLDEYEIGAD